MRTELPTNLTNLHESGIRGSPPLTLRAFVVISLCSSRALPRGEKEPFPFIREDSCYLWALLLTQNANGTAHESHEFARIRNSRFPTSDSSCVRGYLSLLVASFASWRERTIPFHS